MMIDILPYPLPKNYSLPALSESHSSTHNLSQGGFFIGVKIADRLFTLNEINNVINNNGYRIYIFGTITYTDVFKKHRKTKFCNSVIGSPNLAVIGSNKTQTDLEILFEIADQHNDVT